MEKPSDALSAARAIGAIRGRKTNHPETGSNAARSSGDSERGGGIFVEMRRVSSTRHGTNYVSKFPRFFSLDRFGSALLYLQHPLSTGEILSRELLLCLKLALGFYLQWGGKLGLCDTLSHGSGGRDTSGDRHEQLIYELRTRPLQLESIKNEGLMFNFRGTLLSGE